MNRKSTIVIALMGILFSAGAASATPWQNHHPRRAEVNGRLVHQNLRIDRERREGELTKVQARDLHAEDRGIRAEERYDASKDGSHITRQEDRTLNHQENAVGGQIGR